MMNNWENDLDFQNSYIEAMAAFWVNKGLTPEIYDTCTQEEIFKREFYCRLKDRSVNKMKGIKSYMMKLELRDNKSGSIKYIKTDSIRIVRGSDLFMLYEVDIKGLYLQCHDKKNGDRVFKLEDCRLTFKGE